MTAIPLPARRVALRPLALPAEHGGWGFLCEPLVLGLAVVPSWSGGLAALAALFAFLARQPLKLALQDALRGRSYPRTPYCWSLAIAFALGASASMAAAVRIGGLDVLIPIALVAPLGLVQVLFDARNRSRELFAEMSGAIAMSSIAAVIGVAGGMRLVPALALSGIIVARTVPSIVYVRSLLRGARPSIAIALHAVALVAVALFAPPLAIVAMAVLLLRAIWGVTHEAPPAKSIGWREIAYGALTVSLAAIG